MSRLSASWRAGCAATLALVALAGGVQGEEPPAAIGSSPAMILVQRKDAKTPPPASGEAAPKPSAAEAPVPQAPAGAVGEFQPVLHAQGAKITTCMDTIVGESASVIDSAHTAISSWSRAAPNENAFLSIIGLSYANKAAPNAAAVLFAAPVGPGKCTGGTVQVYPVAQSCSSLQAGLIKQGQTIATPQALPVVEANSGSRNVLIPTAGGGCVVIAVGLRQ